MWSGPSLEFTTSIVVNLKGSKKKEEVGRSPIVKYTDSLSSTCFLALSLSSTTLPVRSLRRFGQSYTYTESEFPSQFQFGAKPSSVSNQIVE